MYTALPLVRSPPVPLYTLMKLWIEYSFTQLSPSYTRLWSVAKLVNTTFDNCPSLISTLDTKSVEMAVWVLLNSTVYGVVFPLRVTCSRLLARLDKKPPSPQ